MTLHLDVRLAALLREHSLTQKQLAHAAQMRPATIHAIYHQQVERLELSTVTAIIGGLRKLGVNVDVGDLLSVVEAPGADLAARERALSLLSCSPWGRRPSGSAQLAPFHGAAIEDLLADERGADS